MCWKFHAALTCQLDTQEPCLRPTQHLEGQGDLGSGLIRIGKIGVIMWLIGDINMCAKSPWPRKQSLHSGRLCGISLLSSAADVRPWLQQVHNGKIVSNQLVP